LTIYFDVEATPSPGGWDSSAEACSGTGTDLVIYFTAPHCPTTWFEASTIEGLTLYTNPTLTTILNGGDTWYKDVSSPNTGITIQVGSDGSINQMGDCTLTTTTTASGGGTTTTSTSTTTASGGGGTTSTTTKSPCVYYLSAGKVDVDGHCDADYTATTQIFSNANTQFDCTPTSLLNKFIYTDSNLQNTFNGNGLYYFISEESGASSTSILGSEGFFIVVKIEANGEVTTVVNQDCSGGGGSPE